MFIMGTNMNIPKSDGREAMRHMFIQCESVDTNYSEYEDHVGITIDWEKEETMLERKRKMTLLVIMLAFLVTTAVMVMSVVHVERNKVMEVSCTDNNVACLRLLCKWQARGDDHVEDNCRQEVEGSLGHS
jgi:hypothetical protein